MNQHSSDGASHTGLLDSEVKVDLGNLDQKVVYDVDNWCEILLAVKGRSCPWAPWTFVMVMTTVFLLLDDKYWHVFGEGVMNRSVNPVVHSTFGIVLCFLIVYQSKQSSQRWWEGRIAWENIMSHIREAMRLLCSHCNGRRIIKLFGRYMIAFTITSKHYLRKEVFTRQKRCPDLGKILPPEDLDRLYKVSTRNRPLACLYAVQRITEMAILEKLLNRSVARDINPRFVRLADKLGTCERIMFTPMPWVYTLHLRIVLLLFLVITPLGLFDEKPLPTYLQIYIFTAVLAYAFLGLEDMAVKIQNPFGYNPSHLPLDKFTSTVCKDIREIISMKYLSFDKSYTEKILAIGKYEIDWNRKHSSENDVDDDDDGGGD